MPYDTETPRSLTVAAKTQVADDVVELVLSGPPGTELPTWEPGAHITLQLPDGVARQYSLCGMDRHCPAWTIAVRRAPDSRGGSRYIHDDLRTGESVTTVGPANNFPLEQHKKYVFIAGGIGITPILAMVREIRQRPDADFTFLYCGRSRPLMAYRNEIEDWDDRRVVIHADDEHAGPPDIGAFLADHEETVVFCCGPEPLIAAVENKAPASCLVRSERFRVADTDTSSNTAFDVLVSGSGERIRVAEHESILDALARVGFEVPSSCREGVCGTCETTVVSGTPDHRDSILSPEERAEGTAIMPCISRAHTDEIELDLF